MQKEELRKRLFVLLGKQIAVQIDVKTLERRELVLINESEMMFVKSLKAKPDSFESFPQSSFRGVIRDLQNNEPVAGQVIACRSTMEKTRDGSIPILDYRCGVVTDFSKKNQKGAFVYSGHHFIVPLEKILGIVELENV